MQKMPTVFKDNPLAYGYAKQQMLFRFPERDTRIVEGTATETDLDNAPKFGMVSPSELSNCAYS